ncbi:MAG: hypothetical protein WED09_08050 [Homoserinimonas sp.]
MHVSVGALSDVEVEVFVVLFGAATVEFVDGHCERSASPESARPACGREHPVIVES